MFLATLLPFAVSYAALAMLPGPNFAVVAHAGLSGGRASAFWAVAGVALGASLLAALTVTGSGALAAGLSAPLLASAAYGGLMILFGVRALKRARLLRRTPARADRTARGPGAGIGGFRLAFLTAATNPASALFFATAGIGMGGVDAGGAAGGTAAVLGLAAAVFLVAAAWFGLVALILCRPALRPFQTRFGAQMDAALGAVLVLVGALALVSAASPLLRS